MKTLTLLIKTVSWIKSMMFCASKFSSEPLIEEATKVFVSYIIKINTFHQDVLHMLVGTVM